jgi:hypothetical protein
MNVRNFETSMMSFAVYYGPDASEHSTEHIHV